MSEMIDGKQGIIPRFGQGEQLLGNYDLEIESVTRGRGCLLVHTKGQTYMLKEFTGSKEKITALAGVLRQLQEWDSANEQMLPTKEGNFWVREEGGPAYLLKTYTGGRECDVRNPFEVLEGVRKLADLHLALREIRVESPEVFYVSQHEWEREIYRHNRELRNVRNYIRKKKKINGFEQMYEEAYDYFYRQASQMENDAKRLLEQGKEEECRQLCHGDFHYHNVLDCHQKSRILNYERMRWDNPVSDLAKYVRKALEKNRWNAKLGMEIIATYGRIFPMSRATKEQLYIRLAYPEKFWKIVNHYNNNKKAWASRRDEEKLKHLLGIEQNRQEFLEILYNGLE